MEDTNGKVYNLADFKGKKLYIMFWASWCSHCVNGLDKTNELSKKNNEFKVLTIVSPNFTKEMDNEELKKWFDSLDYNNILDNECTIAKEYGITAYPTNVYIDSNGIWKKRTLDILEILR